MFSLSLLSFYFNDPATTQIYTLSLHDALPISGEILWKTARPDAVRSYSTPAVWTSHGRKELLVAGALELRSEEHTSELQSLTNLVCRLLLEKKKKTHQFDGFALGGLNRYNVSI